jgi:hypothetical protein
MQRRDLALVTLAAGIALATPAFAYRPFDGTDGDVAGEGEFELEVGPAQYLSSPDGHYLMAPATVLNLGIARGLELVVDFKDYIGLQSAGSQQRMRLLDTDVFLKGILRRGTLQGETGVSIALEAGPLLPEIGGTNGFGAQANLITSYRWDAFSLHLNTAAALTREHNMDAFVSLILEGPREWPVRPVAEVYTDHDFGNKETVYSALAGAIWQVRDALALDAAVRYAALPGTNAVEIRFGLTWGVSLWHNASTETHD